MHTPRTSRRSAVRPIAASACLLLAARAGLATPPTIPAPGQTVTWTAAMSPITVTSTATIPAGGTVVVEPGVEIVVDAPLAVHGLLRGGQTGAAEVLIRSSNANYNGSNLIDLRTAGGRVDLVNTHITCTIGQWNGTFLRLTDSWIDWDAGPTLQQFGLRDSVTVLTNTRIDGKQVTVAGQARLEDVTFTGDFFQLAGYTLVDGLTSDASVRFVREYQTMLVDNVHVAAGLDAGVILGSANFGAADFLFTANNTLVGNGYPLKIELAGLHPDSVLPLTGNVNNSILLDDTGGGLTHNRVTIPNLGLPYDNPDQESFIQGAVDIEPGTLFRLGQGAGITWYPHDNLRIRGLPDQPIRFEPLTPGGRWDPRAFQIEGGSGLFENLVIEGGVVIAPEGVHWMTDCVLKNSTFGINGAGGQIHVRGTEFSGNDIGAQEAFTSAHVGFDLDGAERPNIFENNVIAVNESVRPNGNTNFIHAENNWWNHPTGPSSAPAPLGGSYTGEGDPVTDFVVAFPFLTERPDLAADRPPLVRMTTRPLPYAAPGDKILLEWEASDDHGIVEQRIEGEIGPVSVYEVLDFVDPDRRRYELTIPNDGRSRIRFRLVVTDTAGQESQEIMFIAAPNLSPTGTGQVLNDLGGGFTPGQRININYTLLNTAWLNAVGPEFYLDLGADERWAKGPSGTFGTNRTTFSTLEMPRVSTDRARIAIDASGGNEGEWYFSDYFTIRPDAALGDEPPIVEMSEPLAGTEFVGGQVIPIRWTADDDESVRAFKIQYSTNGGFTWHTARHDLPGNARAFDWRLPASGGIADLRLRVVAIDNRFQNSSAGDDRQLTVLPGDLPPPPCPCDFDSSGVQDINDYFAFLGVFFTELNIANPAPGAADFDGDGSVTINDYFAFLACLPDLAAQIGC